MCVQHTGLKLFLDRIVLKPSFCRICNLTFGELWGLWWKTKYLHIKTRQKRSQWLPCDVCIRLTNLDISFHRAVLKHSFRSKRKWIFGLLWGPRWKRECLHIKTSQKHSQRLRCDVCVQLTELNITFHRAVLKHWLFSLIWKWIFKLLWGLRLKREYLHLKIRQKDSQKLLCDVCIQLTDLNLSFHRAALKHSRRRTFNGIFGLLWGLRWKREYLDIKSKQKHSQKLLSDVCIQLTDFNIPFHRAVLKLSFRRICKYIFGLLWGLCWKCKYLPRKSREKHSQILFVMFAFNSRRWTYLFIEQLWNTLFVESASGYLECFEAFIGTRNIFT